MCLFIYFKLELTLFVLDFLYSRISHLHDQLYLRINVKIYQPAKKRTKNELLPNKCFLIVRSVFLSV